jgi:hypothetical protein
MFSARIAQQMFARSSFRSASQRQMHTQATRNASASRLFASSAAVAAGAAFGVWSHVMSRTTDKNTKVVVLAAEPTSTGAPVSAVAEDEFRVFRSRVLPLWYRVVVVFFSLISAGLLYPFVAPVLHFNHLEECVPTMRVNGRPLVWTGEFSAYYTQAMITLGLNVVTLGIYQILGFADQRMETYVDEHIKISK